MNLGWKPSLLILKKELKKQLGGILRTERMDFQYFEKNK